MNNQTGEEPILYSKKFGGSGNPTFIFTDRRIIRVKSKYYMYLMVAVFATLAVSILGLLILGGVGICCPIVMIVILVALYLLYASETNKLKSLKRVDATTLSGIGNITSIPYSDIRKIRIYKGSSVGNLLYTISIDSSTGVYDAKGYMSDLDNLLSAMRNIKAIADRIEVDGGVSTAASSPPVAVPTTRICSNCGAENNINARFCGKCGHELK